MTNQVELMYGIRLPLPNRSRIIIDDCSTKKIEGIGKIALIFNRITDIPATRSINDVSFVPRQGFNFFRSISSKKTT